jgi:hypothetical protein
MHAHAGGGHCKGAPSVGEGPLPACGARGSWQGGAVPKGFVRDGASPAESHRTHSPSGRVGHGEPASPALTHRAKEHDEGRGMRWGVGFW